MKRVIVASRSQAFFESLCRVIGPEFLPIRIFGQRIYRCGGESEPLVGSAEDLRQDCCIAVYREPIPLAPIRINSKRAVAVVDSQSPELLRYLSSTGMLAVTCGLSARDTVTLSSIDTDSAVINLQRSITCFDGAVVEPQEFPVSFSSPVDSFLLMSAACVLILSGEADRLCGISFTPPISPKCIKKQQ